MLVWHRIVFFWTVILTEKDARSGCRERSLHRANPIPRKRTGRCGRPIKSRFQRAGPSQALFLQFLARGQLAPLGACPPLVPVWTEKGIMSTPQTLMSPIPPSMQHSSLFPLASQCSSSIYFGMAQGPVSSCALQTSAGNTQLAPPDKGWPFSLLSHPR